MLHDIFKGGQASVRSAGPVPASMLHDIFKGGQASVRSAGPVPASACFMTYLKVGKLVLGLLDLFLPVHAS